MEGLSLPWVAFRGRNQISSEWRSCCLEDEGGYGVPVAVGSDITDL